MIGLTFEKIEETSSNALIKFDTLIISNLYVYMSAYLDDRDMLIKIGNYAQEKFVNCDSSLREMIYLLLRKVMMARIKVDQKEPEKIPMPAELDCSFDGKYRRYLPKEQTYNGKKLYFDKPHLGWFAPPKEIVFVDTGCPYDSAKQHMTDNEDQFYKKAMNDPSFIENYLQELVAARSVERDVMEAEDGFMGGGLTDIFAIQEEVVSKLLMPQMLSLSNLEIEGNLFLDGMAESATLLFTYYGPEMFIKFKPHLFELLKQKDDPSTQAICSEMISGFLKTLTYYSDDPKYRPLYIEVFDTVLDIFENSSDETGRDWEPCIEYFMNEMDPLRADFLIKDVFKKKAVAGESEHVVTKRLWYFESITDQIDWRARPYVEQFRDQILSLGKINFRSVLLGQIVVSLLRKFEIYNFSFYRYCEEGLIVEREDQLYDFVAK